MTTVARTTNTARIVWPFSDKAKGNPLPTNLSVRFTDIEKGTG